MPGLPIAFCDTNPQHYDYVVEHLKLEFEVVTIFTTPASALTDLPILLSEQQQRRTDALQPSDSIADISDELTHLRHNAFFLAFDPTVLDAGTLPLSPSLFNVSALKPGTPPIVAVVVGEGFEEVFERVRRECGEGGGKVVWFRDDEKKKKRTDATGEDQIVELGKKIKDRLGKWVGDEDSTDRWGGVVHF